MMSTFWYSGAMIAPRKQGFDVLLSKDTWVYRDSLRKAKWIATVYKNVVKKTFKDEYDSIVKSSPICRSYIGSSSNYISQPKIQ